LEGDRVGSRALNFINGDVQKHRNEWNCEATPNLISASEDSHIYHQTNVLPVMNLFTTGVMRTKWRNDNTQDGAVANAAGVLPAVVHANTVILSQVNQQKACYWRAPRRLANLQNFHNLVQTCVINGAALPGGGVPNHNVMYRICDLCNDFMTQQGTMSELLVRKNICASSLVPDDRIAVANVIMPAGGGHAFNGARSTTPNDGNRNGKNFTFQACLAYFLHRCLPERPGPPITAQDREWRTLVLNLSWVLLEMLSLKTERDYGSNGGRNTNQKPQYRYKGMIELYIGYFCWVLLSVDVMEGGLGRCTMPFTEFYRYFFSEVFDTLVVMYPQHASAVELSDIIFGDNWYNAGLAPVVNLAMGIPTRVFGFIANRMSSFYTDLLKPNFSRHMSGVLPNPALLLPGATALQLQLAARQITVYDMLITTEDLPILLHSCDRSVPGDVDSFMNNTGVHAVMRQWNRVLTSAPPRVDKLLNDFTDAWTLMEYQRIQKHSRDDPSLPKVSAAVAECMYLLCNTLEPPSDPHNKEEMDLLRQSLKCSVYKAAPRLMLLGAFDGGDDGD
jgi:hypothetical protein